MLSAIVGNRVYKWLALPLAAVVIYAFVFGPPSASAQTPPPIVHPPVETPATSGGLGDCQEGWKVAVLNDEFNALPEDQSKRNGNGGFETFIVTNCKAYLMNYEVTRCASYQFSSLEICRGGLPPVCTGAGSERGSV